MLGKAEPAPGRSHPALPIVQFSLCGHCGLDIYQPPGRSPFAEEGTVEEEAGGNPGTSEHLAGIYCPF